MAKIPEDVMKAAREVANEIAAPPVWGALPLSLPIIARAILAERERCIAQMISMSDVASRIIAMGWRGNPHMSGDDRDFMGPMQRQRHDGRVAEALGEITAAIRGGSNA